MCDQPLQSDPDQINVCYDARVPPQLDNPKQDNNLSNSIFFYFRTLRKTSFWLVADFLKLALLKKLLVPFYF